jgi:N-acetylmuramoyl-L-alanine amidase
MRRLLPLAGVLLVAACAEPYGPGRVSSAPQYSSVTAPGYVASQPSAEVRDAQLRLRSLGLYDGAIDGMWGPDTQAAVERFQRQHGLALTSRLDSATTRAMRIDVPTQQYSSAIAPLPTVPQPSAEVRDAQHRLRALGLYDGPIDGLWGPETQAAVDRFQRQQGLALSTRLDSATMRALRADNAAKRAAAATPVTVSDPTDVRTLQNRLRQLGFFDRPADGVWGQSTQVALENFQRTRGLPQGQMTTATLSALGLDPAGFPSRTSVVPVRADALDPLVVRDVQRRLRQLGFYSGRVDATWGPQTQAAIERFQQNRGLDTTGQLNPATAAALGVDLRT